MGIASAQGRDVSNYQGAAGAAIPAHIAFQFQKATEGIGFADPFFPANWAACKRAGIRRGAYHFFRPELDARSQAQFFMGIVKSGGLEAGDMLVADVETEVSGVNLDHAVRMFLAAVQAEAPHNPVLVYTNLNVGSQLASCVHYPLWIAHPDVTAPSSVLPWQKWHFWQWGMQQGTDANAFNGTVEEFNAWISDWTKNMSLAPDDLIQIRQLMEAVIREGIDAHGVTLAQGAEAAVQARDMLLPLMPLSADVAAIKAKLAIA